MTFNGFISYSHAADDRLAPAVQRGLHRLAKPWHRRRALWIFRDQTGLAVTPALWSSIQKALDGSDYFVLLASPEAACSPWVNREIEHWVTTKSAEKILPVVTDGQWRWDPVRRDFAADSTAVPAALRGVFTEEPLYLDLRWARDDRHLSLRHSRFRDAIAQLAAPMHGVSKDDLEGEDVRQHRRARQLRSGALTTLVVLLLVASMTGALAVRNAGRANTLAAEALRQQHSALQQRGYAEQSAEEARRQQGLAEQQQSRAVQAARETQRQVRMAQEQRALAEQASVEAGRQERLARDQKAFAEQASVEAGRQEKLARDQKASAARSSAEAGRQQRNARRMRDLADRARVRAQEQQRLAQQQRELAQRWAAQARLQEQNARRHEQDAREQQRKAEEAAREADRQGRFAEQQRTIAVGRRLINQAKATIADDPGTALMLATAADSVQADAESHRELTGLLTSTRYAGVLTGMDSAAFGPGDLVAAHDEARDTVSLWNVADRGRPVRLATLAGDGLGSTLAFSTDGRTLAVVRSPEYEDVGGVVLWNVADPRHPVRAGELPDLTYVSALAFSPDGRSLIAYSETFNPPPTNPPWVMTATLWDVADRTRPHLLSTLDRDDPVDRFAFGPDGRTVVMTGEDRQIWSVADRARPVLLATQDQGDDRPVAFGPHGPVLATTAPDDPRTVVLWNLKDPAQPRRLSDLTVRDGVASMAFHPDGRTLAVSDDVGAVTLIDVADPAEPSRIGNVAGNDRTVRTLAYSRDGRALATFGEAVWLWQTVDYGAPRAVAELDGDHGRTLATAFGPDGRSMMAAYSDGTAASFDVSRPADPVRRATLPLHGGGIHAAAFSADLRTVATAGRDDRVTLTDVTAADRPVTLATIAVPIRSTRPPEILDVMAFSPDGRTLAVGTSESRVMLWDLTDRTSPHLLVTLERRTWFVSMRFSPDGRTLALGGGYGDVELWDLTDRAAPVQRGSMPRRRLGASAAMPAIFSPDGNLLVTQGSSEQTAALWDVTDRSRPHRIAGLTGHSDEIVSAALGADGKTLTTGSADGTVVVWDLGDRGKPLRIATLIIGAAPRAPIALSPDGHTLATPGRSSDDSAVTLWDFAPLTDLRADSARTSCAITGRGLTEEEWSRYIPDIRYQPTCNR